MAKRAENPKRNRQESGVSASDLIGQRSEVNDAEGKNTSDHAETNEKTSIKPLAPMTKSCFSGVARPEATRVFLSSNDAAKLTGITDRGIRDNAAAGKYTDARKVPVNGIDTWAIPLESLPGEAQALYWHEQFTAAGWNEDLFPSGSSFSPEDREAHWKRYELTTPKLRAHAKRSFEAIKRFDERLRHGLKKMAIYDELREEFGVARSTFDLWRKSVVGLAQSDWLPALVPDQAGRTNAKRAEWPGNSWNFFLREATTPGRPLKTAYKSTVREAEAQGWGKLPSAMTARRDFDNIDDAVKTLLREGPTALKRLSPTGERDYAHFKLHEQWSMDGRKIDLMARDVKGEFGPKGRVFRLWLYALMDMRSRYIVGYSIGPELNADAVRDAFLNAVTTTRRIIPKVVQPDNGMEMAAKEHTGGTPWRRRGMVKEDEIIGLFPFLKIEVSWANVAHGQTKPIERVFRTLKEMLETQPEFKGAYCAENPTARPEEWDAKKAAPADLIREKYKEGIAIYHRNPHRGDAMNGKSPWQVYDELMRQPDYNPRKISERQMRVCALSAVKITIQKNGSFIIHGARYWSEETARASKGSGYYARYDRHDLAQPVFVYMGSRLIAENVAQITRIPGNCKESAKKIAKARSEFTRATKARAKALFNIQAIDSPAEIAKGLVKTNPEIMDKETGEILPIAKVIQLTQSAAELPSERTKSEADEIAKTRAMADEIREMMANQGRNKTAQG